MPHNLIRDLMPFRTHREWKLVYDALDAIHIALDDLDARLDVTEGGNFSDVNPLDTALTASPGISTSVSRGDHVHSLGIMDANGRVSLSSLTPVFDLSPLEVLSGAAAVHLALGTKTIAGAATTTLIGSYTTFEIDGSDPILGEGIRVEVETSGDDDAQQVRCLMGYATVSGAGLAKAIHGKAVSSATATATAVLTGVIGQCEVNSPTVLASRCFQASITGETDISDGFYAASNGARNFRVGLNMADAATYSMAAILLPVDNVAAGIRWGTTGAPGDGARINSPVSDQLNLDALGLLFLNSTNIKLGAALQAVGGGAGATLGTIGGSGPTVATQNSWLQLIDSTGATFWVPVWK